MGEPDTSGSWHCSQCGLTMSQGFSLGGEPMRCARCSQNGVTIDDGSYYSRLGASEERKVLLRFLRSVHSTVPAVNTVIAGIISQVEARDCQEANSG